MLERIPYRGWNNAYKISNGTVELIVLADVGPRIISYRFIGGENQLHEVEADIGQLGGSNFRLYGGHRLWVSPELESTYFPDNLPVSVSDQGNKVRFTAPVEQPPPGQSLQKELEVELASSGSEVSITHRLTNHNRRAIQLAPWAPTMLPPGGNAILPLPPKAAMDKDHYQSVGVLAMWSFTDLGDSRWIFGTEYIQLKQLSEPTGRFKEQMCGIYNPAGWGAYYRDGHLFVKRAPVIPGARYPDFGCNFEVFTNPDFLELEILGPLEELRPAESIIHSEHWWLFSNVADGTSDDWVRSDIISLIENKTSSLEID
jgi:hypothetical protein